MIKFKLNDKTEFNIQKRDIDMIRVLYSCLQFRNCTLTSLKQKKVNSKSDDQKIKEFKKMRSEIYIWLEKQIDNILYN